MMEIKWKQHAVGHGGFHTATAKCGDERFSWAFDCGAVKHSQFNKYLKQWAARQDHPLDWLFISHFHSDHTSGLDTLMQEVEVKNVMLPYLNEEELVRSLLYEIDRGVLSRATVELHSDAAAFFLSRGAANIFYLGGHDDDREAEEATSTPIGPEEGGGWQCKIDRKVRQEQAPRWALHQAADSPVQRIDSTSCIVTAAAFCGQVRLKPYRAPITVSELSALVVDVQNLLKVKVGKLGRSGLGKLAYAAATHARNAKGRAELRNIYAKYGGSANRASLSLLSFPVMSGPTDGGWWFNHNGNDQFGEETFGWMNTGDAELLNDVDLKDWEKSYIAELSNIKALALPHHGSDLNSGAAFSALCPNAALIAHVKAKRGKHPGPKVTIAADKRLVLVTDDDRTAARMTFSGWCR